MTDTKGVLGTCNSCRIPHPQLSTCEDWKLIASSKPNRVEIWRYNNNTFTIVRSDGSAFNCPDWLIPFKHDGVWSCQHLDFIPVPNDTFTDGTPIALYEGLAPIEAKEAVL